jgi:SAM-dependent methyltransferase
MKLTAGFFDNVARSRTGLSRVINSGVPDKERETELQKDAIYAMLPAGIWRTLTILDCGCGVGRLTPWLASISKRATGIDWSPEMLTLARQHAGMMRVRFEQGDITLPDCTPQPGQFGCVFEWCVFIHILDDADWRIAVSNMRRMAKKYILYCDKVNDNAVVDYVNVRDIDTIIHEVEAGGEFALVKCGNFVGYEEDVFALLLFKRVQPHGETGTTTEAAPDGIGDVDS